MARIKKAISGRRIAPGIIEVALPNKKELVHGQRVLIYKPTNQPILSPSGRVIGQKEKTLGFGEVAVVGERIIIKTPVTRKVPNLRKTAIKKICQSYKVKNQTVDPSKSNSDTNVFIKPIEE